MKESKGIQIMNRFMIIAGFLVVPYAYYFILRPKLLNLENTIDNKILSINDTDFQTIKSKMDNLKRQKEIVINEENRKL